MAIESNGYEVVPTYNEAYYEELASEEEIYLEATEEELRSKLISDTTQDNRPIPAPYIIRISIERHRQVYFRNEDHSRCRFNSEPGT